MKEFYNIIVPVVNNNDEMVTVSWLVDSGKRVKKGEILAQLETVKTVFDLPSETDGYFYSFCDTDTDRPIADVIGIISLEQLSDVDLAKIQKTKKDNIIGGEKKWTKKAEFLAKERGVRIQDIPVIGRPVTELDIMDYLKSRENMPEPASVDWGLRESAIRLLLIGAGMNALQTLDVLTRTEDYSPVGILDDDPTKKDKSLMGVPVVGTISMIDQLWQDHFFDKVICLLPNDRKKRIHLFESLLNKGIPFANIIDPSVQIHSNITMGVGNLILASVRVGTCSSIGNNNFISSAVNFAHHNRIGDHCTFGPNVVTSGMVSIGNNIKFGMNINVEPHVHIGDNATIASGALLISDVADNSLVKVKMQTVMED